ncbi:MAG: type IV pili methyl-accepting chemotaxis transducer N-terminal domain-containing protein, partial [Alcanivorax nanhaiticus]
MKFNPGAFFEKLRGGAGSGGNSLNIALYVGLAIFIVLALVNFLLSATTANKAQENITRASEMRVISQQIAKNSLEAAAGNADAFELLDKSRKSFQEAWDAVKGEKISDPMVTQRLQTLWNEVDQNTATILKGEDTVLDLHEVADTLAQTIPALQAEYEGVVEILVTTGADPEQIAFAQRQSWLAERIVRSISKVLEGGDGAVIAADSFGRDASQFGRVMNGMIEGDSAMGIDQVNDPDALDYLAEIADLFDEFVNQSVDEILETAPELFQVRNAADTIFRRSQDLLQESTNLNNQFEGNTTSLFPSVWFGVVCGLIAILLFALI